MKFFIDATLNSDGRLAVTGWAVPERASARLFYAVTKEDGTEVPAELHFRRRPDVAAEFIGDPFREDSGYYLEIDDPGKEKRILTVTEKEGEKTLETKEIPLSGRSLSFREKARKWKRILEKPRILAFKVKNRLLHTEANRYEEWFLRHRTPEEELLAERKSDLQDGPLFSVVVPLYRTPLPLFQETAASLTSQTYARIEPVFVYAEDESVELKNALKSLSETDGRVKLCPIAENGGIARNTNAGINASTGDFVSFLDHDDLLEPDAVFRLREALAARPEADVLYTDEDKITEDGSRHYDPFFKPAYDPVLLLANQYICHFTAVRRSRLMELGGLREGFDGAQDHDLMLRLSEVTDRFVHVAKVLYHWRSVKGSTAGGTARKTYAEQAGIRAVNEALKRRGIAAEAGKSAFEGRYRLSFSGSEEPLVSVLIANKDHAEDLKRIVTSLFEKSTYRNFEVLILENNSVEQETFRLYEALEKTYPALCVLKYEGPFHYAKLHNDAVKEAKGEYLLLLNNDTEVLTPEFLTRMVAWAKMPGTGAVGAKLLYPDNTVQHVGIVTPEGDAFHPFKGMAGDAPGYMCRAVTPECVSAVTGACLFVRKELWNEVGGMDEHLSVALNDVDLCLKFRKAGYRNMVDAESRLFHFESKSRGADDTKEKFLRVAKEFAYFGDKWRGSELFPDPYYPSVFSTLYAYERKD